MLLLSKTPSEPYHNQFELISEYKLAFKTKTSAFRLTWTRPNTFQLGLKCVSRTWLPIRGRGRVSTSSGPVDYGSPTRVIAERPLTPFCETAVNCNGISLKLVRQVKIIQLVIFVIILIILLLPLLIILLLLILLFQCKCECICKLLLRKMITWIEISLF